MIRPWQVWATEGTMAQLVVVISSPLHLGTQQGRCAIVLPLTDTHMQVGNHVPVAHPGGGVSYVMTEQPRFVSTTAFPSGGPRWEISGEEITEVQFMLALMLELA